MLQLFILSSVIICSNYAGGVLLRLHYACVNLFRITERGTMNWWAGHVKANCQH